ncbi:MAG: type II secretion system F family protein, partial [Oligoflexia bacterium]|nr:type II secretion system F family protein [Oligoflexia bacterium]
IAEKAGAQAATKILFPMMFLITPAVFIIIAAPMALQFVAN